MNREKGACFCVTGAVRSEGRGARIDTEEKEKKYHVENSATVAHSKRSEYSRSIKSIDRVRL